jgi:hypothetical protein
MMVLAADSFKVPCPKNLFAEPRATASLPFGVKLNLKDSPSTAAAIELALQLCPAAAASRSHGQPPSQAHGATKGV